MLLHIRRHYLRSSWFYLAGILFLLLLFTSCKDALPPTDQATPTSQQATVAPPGNLVSPHTLTIGIYTNYFPQEYIDDSKHQLIGFDIDVIQALAQRLHLRTKFIAEDYSMLISDLMISRFDVVISAVSITPELQKKVDFIPYFKGGESLLVIKGNPYQIHAPPDLCGHKVAIKEGTFEQRELKDISATCIRNTKMAISIVTCPQYNAALQQLLQRSVAVIYQDSPVTDYFIKQNPGHLEQGGAVIGANTEGIAVRKNNASLLSALQKTFTQMKEDGTYRSAIARWGLIHGDITTSDAKADLIRPAFAAGLLVFQ